MVKDVEQVRNILKNHCLKATPQRVVIYQIMNKLGHASADMIYGEISDQFSTLTIATIYNVLESFVDAGLVHRRLSANNKMYFDINTYNHCHLYSQEQNKYQDYDDPQLIEMLESYFSTKKLKNFELSNVEIQLNGSFK